MNYYEPGNFLIIHGGRNDFQSESFALNDTFIFDLDLYQWNKVNLFSDSLNFKIISRCGHDSVIYSDKLIIFGGMNNKNYIGSSLFIICLNDESLNINSNKSFTNKNNKENSKEIILNLIKIND